LDRRKAADVIRWLEQQVSEGEIPEWVALAGPHLSQTLTAACERLTLPWLGLSDRRRVYWLGEGPAPRKVKAAQVLEADYEGQWQQLTDAGYQIAVAGPALAKGMGQVVLWVAPASADHHPLKFAAL
jgi:hypothetical protein